tara:strand:- start:612 stop:830 length:219 start_codon:yes stop_codon:yes gene_type:complete
MCKQKMYAKGKKRNQAPRTLTPAIDLLLAGCDLALPGEGADDIRGKDLSIGFVEKDRPASLEADREEALPKH